MQFWENENTFRHTDTRARAHTHTKLLAEDKRVRGGNLCRISIDSCLTDKVLPGEWERDRFSRMRRRWAHRSDRAQWIARIWILAHTLISFSSSCFLYGYVCLRAFLSPWTCAFLRLFTTHTPHHPNILRIVFGGVGSGWCRLLVLSCPSLPPSLLSPLVALSAPGLWLVGEGIVIRMLQTCYPFHIASFRRVSPLASILSRPSRCARLV